jgi:iron complex transport system permease protein
VLDTIRLRRARVTESDTIVVGRSLAAPVVLGAVLLASCAGFSLLWGAADVPPGTIVRILLDHAGLPVEADWTVTQDAIIWELRLPRVLLAGLVGAILGYSGAAYQGVFRNPLAEPYLLGVASGAGLGATLVLVSPLAYTYGVFSPVPAAAFAGALIAVALTYSLARAGGTTPMATLLLAGVAVGAIATASISYLMLSNSDRTLPVLSWLLGGFNNASWSRVSMLAPYAALGFALLLPFGRTLNVMQLPEEQARYVGVNVERTRVIVLAISSLATAAAVAVCGIIGFVGLIVPHVARMLWGADHRLLVPLSALLGASLLILADLVARTIAAPHEIPVGIITAFIGAPFFLYLLRSQRRASLYA